MKRIHICMALVSLSVLAFAATGLITPAELVKNAEKHDEKQIIVSGKISEFQQKKSRVGNFYFTFKLKEDEHVVNVYSRGEADKELKNGVEVHVTGIFRKEKKLQDFAVKNEVDATKVDEKPYGVKLAPKAKDDK